MLDQFATGESAGAIAHRILVIENDADQAAELRDLLQKHGFQVQTAKDGGQAHSALQMYKPDFVITALMLPGETGYEICERFKQRNSQIPILVLTEITLEDSRKLATRVGADGYMTKPYTASVLISQISEIAQQVWDRTHLGKNQEEGRVRFNCRCGKRFKMSPKHRGRTLTCPDCGEPLVVPHHD